MREYETRTDEYGLARHRAIYKLYVIREVSGPPVPVGMDPCVLFFALLLPELNKALFPEPAPA